MKLQLRISTRKQNKSYTKTAVEHTAYESNTVCTENAHGVGYRLIIYKSTQKTTKAFITSDTTTVKLLPGTAKNIARLKSVILKKHTFKFRAPFT